MKYLCFDMGGLGERAIEIDAISREDAAMKYAKTFFDLKRRSGFDPPKVLFVVVNGVVMAARIDGRVTTGYADDVPPP